MTTGWALLPSDHDLSQHIDDEMPQLLGFLVKAMPSTTERQTA
ncbi:MAG: hypothetical protein ACTH3D_05145 [Halomonas sp.]